MRGLSVIIAIVVTMLLAGCGDGPPSSAPAPTPAGGLGITTNGRVGLKLAPGLGIDLGTGQVVPMFP